MIEPKTAVEHEVLNLTDADLAKLEAAVGAAEPFHFGGTITASEGKRSSSDLLLPAKRSGGPEKFGTVQHSDAGRAAKTLLIAAGRYLPLLPAAVDLIGRVRAETLREAALIARTAVGDGASLNETHLAISIAEAIEQRACLCGDSPMRHPKCTVPSHAAEAAEQNPANAIRRDATEPQP